MGRRPSVTLTAAIGAAARSRSGAGLLALAGAAMFAAAASAATWVTPSAVESTWKSVAYSEPVRELGDTPARAGRPTAPPIGGPAGAAMLCATWEGASSVVTICQPDVLRAAIRNGNISLRIRPNLRIRGFRGRITAAPGITQAIGQPLQAGQTATIRGPLQSDTDLVVRVRDKKRRWVALFKLPGLSKNRIAILTVRHGSPHPLVSIRWLNRQLAARYFGPDN
jgi:hypothetical protein